MEFGVQRALSNSPTSHNGRYFDVVITSQSVYSQGEHCAGGEANELQDGFILLSLAAYFMAFNAASFLV